jgi:hypothetical protein
MLRALSPSDITLLGAASWMRSLKVTVASVAEGSADPAHPAIIANDKQAVILTLIVLLSIFDSMSFAKSIWVFAWRFYVAARIRGFSENYL